MQHGSRGSEFSIDKHMVNSTKPKMIHDTLEFPQWKSTMEDEFDSLMRNDIWELIDLLPNKKAFRCKYMFKIKYKVDGTLDKHKS